MADLTQTLSDSAIKSVLIVDDAFDPIPRPEDLTLEEENWVAFFHDISDDEKKLLIKDYPQYEIHRQNVLPSIPDFIAAVWANRDRLRPEIVGPIFDRYEEDINNHLALLKSLEDQLISYGLTITKKGRDFAACGDDVDLIVIDLFLGSVQTQADSNLSIGGLKKIILNRPTNPPIVILMSNSPFLLERRISFRNQTELYESAFRFIKKADLSTGHELKIILSRLAIQKEATLLLINFVTALRNGVSASAERVSTLIRKLGLTDIAHIQQLLLNAEGEPTGSYLVDVFDRALQFEVEDQTPIIDAAKALNNLNVVDYPPLYVPDSPDLLSLVYKTLFQNKSRISLSETEGGRVFFGDILRRVDATRTPSLLKEIGLDDVMLVVTPACDLQRPGQGVRKVMFMIGTLHQFNLTDWRKSNDSEIKTPIIELEDGTKHWIRWKPKHVETLSYAQLEKFLSGDTTKLTVIARVRESHALELQQKLLSSMGRVGLIAPLPASIPMKIDIYLPDVNKELFKLDIPTLAESNCTCYSGRKTDQSMKLVIPELACEAIAKALLIQDSNIVHQTSRPALEYLKTSTELNSISKGIDLPEPYKPESSTAPGLKPMLSPSGAMVGSGENAKLRIVGYILFASHHPISKIDSNKLGNCGLVIVARPL